MSFDFNIKKDGVKANRYDEKDSFDLIRDVNILGNAKIPQRKDDLDLLFVNKSVLNQG